MPVKAFVFGKFLPFHKGHEAMIEFALSKCDLLTVLVCCSDFETIECSRRVLWIEKSFEHQPGVTIQVLQYKESELPNTSVASEAVSALWAKKFKALFPDYTLLITSEPYGEFVARYMGIQHIPFDPPRKLFPVSASHICDDLFSYWHFIPDAVKKDLAIKVAIVGTESTGKTTLTQQLGEYFQCSYILETAREIIATSKSFSMEDLYMVVTEHTNRISAAVTGVSPLLIIDTDVHTTNSYSTFFFNREMDLTRELYDANRCDLYLYLNNDVEFVQDGTRLAKEKRDQLDVSHRELFKKYQVPIIEIAGDWEERYKQSVEHVQQLVHNKKKIVSNLNKR